MSDWINAIANYCCTPTQKNRREEELLMRQKLKPAPGHFLVRKSKNGRRELKIKNLQPEHLQMLFNQDVTLIIQDSDHNKSKNIITSMSERQFNS